MKLEPMIPLPLAVALLVLALLAAVILYTRQFLAARKVELKPLLRFLRTLGIVILIFIIALRPMRESKDADVKLSNLDIMFVVDETISMWAEDYEKGPRMDGVKEDIQYIMMMLPGANYGLITFSDYSEVLSPFTQDTDTMKGLLKTFRMPDTYAAEGTNLNTPLHDLESLLVSSSKKENRQAIVFFFSDGEITDGSQRESYADLAAYISGGAVLGYGTAEGGKMADKYYGYIYTRDYTKEARSVIDEKTLGEMAEEMGITYLHREPGAALGPILTQIQAQSKMVSTTKKNVVLYKDTYYYYAPVLMGLLLWSFVEVLGELPARRLKIKGLKKKE